MEPNPVQCISWTVPNPDQSNPGPIQDQFTDVTKGGNGKHEQKTAKAWYQCRYCEKSFNTKKYLIYHRLKTCPKLLSCDQCDVKRMNAKSLLQHKEQSHAVSVAWECTEQGCKKSSKERGCSFKVHIRKHKVNVFYWCNVCVPARGFSDVEDIKIHLMLNHSGQGLYACFYNCGNNFVRQDELAKHERSCKNNREHYDCECGESFPTMELLRCHYQVNRWDGLEKTHKCGHCPRKFFCQVGLSRHLYQTHAFEHDDDREVPEPEESKFVPQHVGNVTELSNYEPTIKEELIIDADDEELTTSPDDLANTILITNPRSLAADNSYEIEFMVPKEEPLDSETEQLDPLAGLADHVQTPSSVQAISWSLLPKDEPADSVTEYSTSGPVHLGSPADLFQKTPSSGFSNRRKTSNSNVKNQALKKYQCRDCKQKFVAKAQLTSHRWKKCPKLISCGQCNVKSVSPDVIARHRKMVHTVTVELKCSEPGCRRRLLKNCYDMHKITHKVDTFYWCNACDPGRCFTDLEEIKRHLELDHSGQGLRSCSNAGCGETFVTWHDWRKHEDSCGKIVIKYNCETCGQIFHASRLFELHKRMKCRIDDDPIVPEVQNLLHKKMKCRIDDDTIVPEVQNLWNYCE